MTLSKKKLKVEVEVWGVEVEETQRYDNGNGSGWWKFEYSVKINGGKKKFGQEDGSWSNQTKRKFMKVMRGTYPAYEVLRNL